MNEFEFAIQVMILGFLVVLFTLFILFVLIHFFGRILSPPGNDPPHNINIAPHPAFEGLSPRVIAVITLAINSYLKNDSFPHLIKQIKPVPFTHTTSAWVIQGRKDLINTQEEIDQYRRDKSGNKDLSSYR